MTTQHRFEASPRLGQWNQFAVAVAFLLASLSAVGAYWCHFRRHATAVAVNLTTADFDDKLSDAVERMRFDFAEAFNTVEAIGGVAGVRPSDGTPGWLAGEVARTAAAAGGHRADDMPIQAVYMTLADPSAPGGVEIAGLTVADGKAATGPADGPVDAALAAVIRRHEQQLCGPSNPPDALAGLSSAVMTPAGRMVVCSAPYAGAAGKDRGGVISALFAEGSLLQDLDAPYFTLVHPADGDAGVLAHPGAAAAIGSQGWACVRRGEAPAVSASPAAGYTWSHSTDVPASDAQPWRVVATVPAAAFYATPDFGPVRSQGKTILTGGTVASLLLTGLVWALSTGRARAQGVARAMVQDLVRATAAAEAATRAKSEFLAHMSHEIRTPLNGVAGMFDLLRGTELTPLQARYARVGRDAADSLLHVINDILDFSKIEAGKVEIEAIEFDLTHLVGSLLELLDPIATGKGLRLACELPAGLPGRSVGDPTRVRQVLTNLLSNAIKFTAAGSVTVRAAVVSAADDADVAVRLEVVDTGMGIPADRLHRLFESFSQVDASTSRRFGGTGLGLAISKRLVELMGGGIGVQSEAGRGTTFWFTVRLGRATAAAAPVGPTDTSDRLAGMHLLVADDNEVNRFLAGELLRRAGCTFDLVEDGAAAVAAAARGGYDAVLMDCQMPHVDGLQATRQIREREGTGPRVPILALTAEAIDGDRQRCLDAGMDGYVTKPIDTHQLLAALRSATAVPRRRAA
jgi:signal transduction histidine kinase/ActR/RegA family two-component response regulator